MFGFIRTIVILVAIVFVVAAGGGLLIELIRSKPLKKFKIWLNSEKNRPEIFKTGLIFSVSSLLVYIAWKLLMSYEDFLFLVGVISALLGIIFIVFQYLYSYRQYGLSLDDEVIAPIPIIMMNLLSSIIILGGFVIISLIIPPHAPRYNPETGRVQLTPVVIAEEDVEDTDEENLTEEVEVILFSYGQTVGPAPEAEEESDETPTILEPDEVLETPPATKAVENASVDSVEEKSESPVEAETSEEEEDSEATEVEDDNASAASAEATEKEDDTEEEEASEEAESPTEEETSLIEYFVLDNPNTGVQAHTYDNPVIVENINSVTFILQTRLTLENGEKIPVGTILTCGDYIEAQRACYATDEQGNTLILWDGLPFMLYVVESGGS